jgi:hypothetical protein
MVENKLIKIDYSIYDEDKLDNELIGEEDFNKSLIIKDKNPYAIFASLGTLGYL